jgi:transketolase
MSEMDLSLLPMLSSLKQKSQSFLPNNLRRIIIEQSKRAGVGHIGSALSIVEIITALYGHVLNVSGIRDPNRDRFILSKGHAALALYGAFHLKGWISKEELDTFCGNGSKLGVHPEHILPHVDFATGSLGQGLSFGVGAALAAHHEKANRQVYVLLSDAEMNEGAVWEAIMFARQHKLSNLCAILDANGQQAFGYTRDVLDQTNISERLQSFGWQVNSVDGHNVNELVKTIHSPINFGGAPRFVIARTVFGKGVSFMENKIKWHYSPLSDHEYKEAMAEIDKHS